MEQLSLELDAAPSGWGGARKGAGRPKEPGAGVPHLRRERHVGRHPVHATVRVLREAAWLRHEVVFRELRGALARASRGGFRVLEFAALHDHLHLLVEADDAAALARGMQALGVRVARAVNRALRRRGRVWADRYHARDLGTPREVRNALVYVLHNARKHRATLACIDPRSSAAWFDGFRPGPLAEIVHPDVVALRAGGERPTVAPRTWLAGVGWRRLGLIGLDEVPSARRSQRSLS